MRHVCRFIAKPFYLFRVNIVTDRVASPVMPEIAQLIAKGPTIKCYGLKFSGFSELKTKLCQWCFKSKQPMSNPLFGAFSALKLPRNHELENCPNFNDALINFMPYSQIGALQNFAKLLIKLA